MLTEDKVAEVLEELRKIRAREQQFKDEMDRERAEFLKKFKTMTHDEKMKLIDDISKKSI